MKYEDFWSIYFTILRIFLIFYLTHICIYLFNCHHPSYLSETASFLPMFLLLILNYCCSDGIIVKASDVFGYRVLCYHPVQLVQLNWLSASCQSASCQIILLESWFLPCWFSPGVGLLSWYPVGRSPSPDSLWSLSIL